MIKSCFSLSFKTKILLSVTADPKTLPCASVTPSVHAGDVPLLFNLLPGLSYSGHREWACGGLPPGCVWLCVGGGGYVRSGWWCLEGVGGSSVVGRCCEMLVPLLTFAALCPRGIHYPISGDRLHMVFRGGGDPSRFLPHRA